MTEPLTIEAGTSLAWTREVQDRPSSSWALTYYAVRATRSITIATTANADGVRYDVSLTSSDTTGWEPGEYRLRGYVVSGGSRERVYDGPLVVEPDAGAGNAVDLRSSAERTLEAVTATIENRATSDQLQIQLGGRMISRIPLPELERLQTKLKWQVMREKGEIQGFTAKVAMTFRRPQ